MEIHRSFRARSRSEFFFSRSRGIRGAGGSGLQRDVLDGNARLSDGRRERRSRGFDLWRGGGLRDVTRNRAELVPIAQ